MKDLVKIQPMVDSHAKMLLKMIKELQDIKEIQENDEAGRKYTQLKKTYTSNLSKSKSSFIIKLWKRYEGLLFFGLFIVSYILLILGFFQ